MKLSKLLVMASSIYGFAVLLYALTTHGGNFADAIPALTLFVLFVIAAGVWTIAGKEQG